MGGEGDEGVARAVELRYVPSLLLEPIAVPCRSSVGRLSSMPTDIKNPAGITSPVSNAMDCLKYDVAGVTDPAVDLQGQ